MTTDISELVSRFRAEGHEQVKAAHQDVARTGREAEAATDSLSAAEERRSTVDRTTSATARDVAQETHGVTRAMQGAEREVKDTTRAMQVLDRTMGQTAAAARRLDADAVGATRAMQGIDGRGIAMQLSQVAQQSSATGDPLRALAIQLPDIGLAFGTVGIAAGVAAGALLPLAANMLSADENAEDASEAVDEFAEALGRYQDFADTAMESTEKLQERFGRFASEVRAHAQFMAQMELSSGVQGLDETAVMGGMQGAMNAIASLDLYRESLADIREQYASGIADISQVQAAEDALGIFVDRADDAAEALGLTTSQARELAPLVRNIEAARLANDVEALAEATSEAQQWMRQTYDGAIMIPEAVQDWARKISTVNALSAQASQTMASINRSADDLRRSDMDAGLRPAVDEARKLAEYLGISLDAVNGIYDRGGGRGGDPNLFGDPFRRGPDMTPYTQPRSNFDMSGMEAGALEALARLEAAAGMTFNVNSAHRSSAHNERVGGASGSKHLTGQALDLDVSALSTSERNEIIRMARQVAGFGGVGVYRNALHLDTGATRAWGPDYSSGSIPGWAKAATETPRAGDAEQEAKQTRAMNVALRQTERIRRDSARAAAEETRAMDQSQRAWDQLMGSLEPVTAAHQKFEQAQEAINEALERGQITAQEAAHARTLAREEMQRELEEIEGRARESINDLMASYDPATAAAQRFEEAQREINEALAEGAISASEAAKAMALARQDYEQTLADLEEEARQENFGEIEKRIDSIADAMANAIVSGENMGDALRNIFRQIAADILSAGIKEALMGVFNIPSSGGGGSIFSAIGAIFGGGSSAADAPSFDGGGYTGNAPRSGGLDGKGGFWAVMHPEETVIDHTKPQGNVGAPGRLDVGISFGETGGLVAVIRDEAGREVARRETAIVRKSVAATRLSNREEPFR